MNAVRLSDWPRTSVRPTWPCGIDVWARAGDAGIHTPLRNLPRNSSTRGDKQEYRSIDWNIRIMTGFKPTTLSVQNLARSYEVAGVPAPKTLKPSPVLAAIRELPTVEAVEREIVAALQDRSEERRVGKESSLPGSYEGRV